MAWPFAEALAHRSGAMRADLWYRRLQRDGVLLHAVPFL